MLPSLEWHLPAYCLFLFKSQNVSDQNVFVFQMFDAVEDIKKNNKVRSVILCSCLPGIFCAGTLGILLYWRDLLRLQPAYFRFVNLYNIRDWCFHFQDQTSLCITCIISLALLFTQAPYVHYCNVSACGSLSSSVVQCFLWLLTVQTCKQTFLPYFPLTYNQAQVMYLRYSWQHLHDSSVCSVQRALYSWPAICNTTAG